MGGVIYNSADSSAFVYKPNKAVIRCKNGIEIVLSKTGPITMSGKDANNVMQQLTKARQILETITLSD